MTPVERMARAIAAVEGWELPHDMTLPYAPGSRIGMAMHKARAALEAIRKSSEAMIEAMEKDGGHSSYRWEAAIDAALSET